MKLNEIVEAYGAIEPYRHLQAETKALTTEQEWRFAVDQWELDMFLTYLKATQLFYDCLQVAYTSDRRAFEDRILLPPPLTEWKV